MIGCPSCAGVLQQEGERGPQQFRCSVGHAFSLRELYQAKEEELERAQWSAIVLLKHLQHILDWMKEADDAPGPPDGEALPTRFHQTERQAAALERIIDETAPLAWDVDPAHAGALQQGAP